MHLGQLGVVDRRQADEDHRVAVVVRGLEELLRLGGEQGFLLVHVGDPDDERVGEVVDAGEQLVLDPEPGRAVARLLGGLGQRQGDAASVGFGCHPSDHARIRDWRPVVGETCPVIRMLLAFIVVFIVATFPATWLLMLFLGNAGVHVGYVGMLPHGHPRLGPARRRVRASAATVPRRRLESRLRLGASHGWRSTSCCELAARRGSESLGSSWVMNTTVRSRTRVDPVERARRAAPAVIADAAGHLGLHRVDGDAHAEPEADAVERRLAEQRPPEGREVGPAREVVGRHVVDRPGREEAHTVELAAAPQHLGEADVVAGRRAQPAAARAWPAGSSQRGVAHRVVAQRRAGARRRHVQGGQAFGALR